MEVVMTFDQFLASRQWRDDIQRATGFDLGVAHNIPGYTYGPNSKLYIIARSLSPYVLEWMGKQTESEDLSVLERQLFYDAKVEGYL